MPEPGCAGSFVFLKLCGNVFETHVDHWHAEEMRILLGDRIISEISGDVVAYFLAQGDL